MDRRRQTASATHTTYRRWIDEHGVSRAASDHPWFEIWRGIKRRTSDATDPNYGGRVLERALEWDEYAEKWRRVGIRMFPGWINDPVAFFEYVEKHLGRRPTYVTAAGKTCGQSIDRIDNDGDYWPGNIKWSTASEQNGNRRSWAKDPRGVPCLCVDGPHTDATEACAERELFSKVRLELLPWLRELETAEAERRRAAHHAIFGTDEYDSVIPGE